MKKISIIILSLLMLFSLVACGGKGTDPGTAPDTEFYNGGYDSIYTPESPSSAQQNAAEKQDHSKMIFRANIDLETLEFDAAMDSISRLVANVSGYFQEQELASYSSGYRYARMVIRVPSKDFEDFCGQVGNVCHTVHMNTTQENISESYYDVESRLKTARTKLERLQELLSRADNMADIITIEDAIADTEQTIDYLSGTLRGYDSLVDYATVRIDLDEVYRFTGTGDAPLTLGQRLKDSFSSGLTSIGSFFENVLLFLAYAWFWILLVAAAVIIVIRIGRKKRIRKKDSALHDAQSSQQT